MPKCKPAGYWLTSGLGATAGGVMACNSVLELNAVAWAIDRAANMGINPH